MFALACLLAGFSPLPEPTAGGETEWLEMAVAGLLSKELAGREPEGRALGEARRQLVGGEKPPSPPSPPPVCGDLFVGEAHSAITGAAAAVQDGSVLEVCETVCEANKRCYCGVLKGAVLDALPEGPLRLTANTAITTACLTSFNWKKLVCTPACKAISSAVADSSAPANLQMATDASCVSVATGVTDAWCQETCSNQAQCPTTVCRCEPDEPAGRRLQFAQEAEVSDTINGFLLDGSRSDLLELSLAKLLTPHLLGSGFFTEPIVATTRGGAIDHGSRRLANGDCADTLAADAVMAVRHTTAFVTAPYKDRTDMCKTLCTENKDCYCHILKGPLVDNALEQSSMSTAGVASIKSAIFGACATSLTWRTSACVPACNVVAATTTVVEGALSYLESVLQIFGLSVAELVRKQLLKPLAQAA
uniref:Uncharacterized protein n=1 Tax=Emiliania huxleyi TaxID=2903 RepID=A0A7S3S0Z2_EMIHU